MAERQISERMLRAAIDDVVATERRLCARYSARNPAEAERRKRDADLYILGAEMVWERLHNRVAR